MHHRSNFGTAGWLPDQTEESGKADTEYKVNFLVISESRAIREGDDYFSAIAEKSRAPRRKVIQREYPLTPSRSTEWITFDLKYGGARKGK